ncbi:MAG: thermonuclease family protein [Caulobacteraceae bacterium]
MAKSRFPVGLAAFAALVVACLGAVFLSSDPTPAARADTTHVASGEAPQGSPGRSGDGGPQMHVIDGDTFEDVLGDITYRVVNIDTPETGPRARCDAERALGNRATELARTLITRAQNLELRPTGRIDRYGRTIAFVLIDGRDLGETLIAEGLARPWRGLHEPWCDAGGNLIP